MGSPFQFILFLITAISVYSLLNYYFLRKHRFMLTGRSLPALLLRLIVLTLFAAPVATFIFSSREEPLAAAVSGFTGYSWLAFLFLFLVVHGSIDIAAYIAEKAGFRISAATAKKITAAAVLINASAIFFGYYQAGNIKVERIEISSPKIAEGKTLRIAQISDVHFSPMISVGSAGKIRSIIEELKPDIVISTGDFLDRAIRNRGEVAEIMRGINAPLGKFAIMGNHEFISGVTYSEAFIRESGFILLRNESRLIADTLNLAGVDDISAKRFGIVPSMTEAETLAAVDKSKYTILMKHQPLIDRGALPLFDLQLSGHTHGGQIFPFTLLVKIQFPYLCGMHSLEGGRKIYVNRGTGTWGPPVRFLVSPEITLIELKRGD